VLRLKVSSLRGSLHIFESVSEIDRRLQDFNLDYQRYLNYQRTDTFKENKNFSYCVYFIRKIYQKPESTKGYIQRERQFESKLPFFYLQLIKKIPFEINKASVKKVVDFYLSYNR
jgi:hypothetical protein